MKNDTAVDSVNDWIRDVMLVRRLYIVVLGTLKRNSSPNDILICVVSCFPKDKL